MKLPLLLIAAALPACAGNNALPDWARAAMTSMVPQYPAKVSAVRLLAEEQLTVESNGKRTAFERGVVRVMQGHSPIRAYRDYERTNGRIREIEGWIVAPDGSVTAVGKDRVSDISLAGGAGYDDIRAKVLEAGELTPGSTFAYEIAEEERTIFTQYNYQFQTSEPVLVSRFVLNVPAGWEVRGTMFNHSSMEPTVSNNSYVWQLQNLPWIEPEPHQPDWGDLLPHLAVTYFPASGVSAGLPNLTAWRTVSAWLSGMVDPPAQPTAAIAEKAAELTRSASTEVDKIRSIAAFAQATNYISIQLNVTRGGGYVPHPAGDVLKLNYGDCKDKSTLMRALLQAAGIPSYLTVIYSGDRVHVRPEWVSPMQFNHAIVAVRVAPETNVASILNDPTLGRLLFFDPTDPYTPVGDLPEDEQGSYALVIAGDKGNLVKAPMLEATNNRTETAAAGELTPDGHLKATLETHYFGQSATDLRYLKRTKSADDLKRLFERRLSTRLGGLALNNLQQVDEPDQNRLRLNLSVEVEHFARTMQARMLLIRPGALAPSSSDYEFSEKTRKLPVALHRRIRNDSVVIQLPAGFQVDELPDRVDVKGPFGTYRAAWRSDANKLSLTEALEVKEITVAPDQYENLSEFFRTVAGAQNAPVILVRP